MKDLWDIVWNIKLFLNITLAVMDNIDKQESKNTNETETKEKILSTLDASCMRKFNVLL